MEQQKIRVLIVDDSSFMRNILTRIIERSDKLEVVGKAVNGKEGIEMAAALNPDVITMDIEMPEMNGLQALQYIMLNKPKPVVMISSLTESGAEATMKALSLGAVDFIPKALNDADNAIFRNAEGIHERLIAAARVPVQALRNSRGDTSVPVQAVSQPTAPTTSRPAVPSPTDNAPARQEHKPVTTQIRPKLDRAKLLFIGSSTGGPRALQDVLAAFPATLRVPVIIVQHMPANFTGPMAARLNDLCALNVVEAKEGLLVEKGFVYVCPGGVQARIVQKEAGLAFKIKPDEGESVFKPSVDVMGESVAQVFGGDVVAAMLTGMGHDGAIAFKKLRDLGGYILAQDQATSVVYGMPKAVEQNGAANEILPLSEIGSAAVKILQ